MQQHLPTTNLTLTEQNTFGRDDSIVAYPVSTAYDLNTVGGSRSQTLALGYSPSSLQFADSGSTMRVADQSSTIHIYDLSTVYDLSTATETETIDVSDTTTSLTGASFYNPQFLTDGSQVIRRGFVTTAQATTQQALLKPTFTGQNTDATATTQAGALNFLGTSGEITVLIDGQRIDTYTNIDIERRLNEVDTFAFEAFIEDSTDRALINEGNDVKIIENNNTLLFKGRLTEVEYQSSFRAKCEGDGMVTKLLNRKTGRDTYTNTAGDDIVKNVVDSNVISYGDIETAPQVSVRFDHDNWARAVAGIANATGYDWYIDHGGVDYETDFLNFVQDAGDTGVLTRINVEEDFEDGTVNGFTGGGDVTLTATGTNPITGTYSLSVQHDSDTAPFGNASYSHSSIDSEYVASFKFKGFADNDADDPVHQIEGYGSAGSIWDISYREDASEIELDFADGSETLSVTAGEVYDITVRVQPGETLKYTVNNQTRSGSPVNNGQPDGLAVYAYTGGPFDGTVTATTVFDDLTIDTPEADKKTFEIGGNAQMVDRDKDDGFVANDITLLGRGDGINQLEARVFAATTHYTDTTEVVGENLDPIPSVEGPFFKVEDTTQLGDTNDTLKVRVGSEVMRVQVDTDIAKENLEVIDRALNDYEGNSTEQIKHAEGIRVWLVENETQGIGPFTPETQDTAEDGSSVEVRGVKQERSTDKTLVDITTLEKTADLELKNRFEDVFRVQINPTEPRVTEYLDLGDTVRVQDLTAMNVDNTFDIVGIDIRRASSQEGTILHLANRPRRLTERLSDIERDRNTLNAHMQGATNIDSQNFNDNADNTHPLSADLRIPNDAVAVNKTELTFKREPFRGYVQQITESSAETGEYINSVYNIVEAGQSDSTPGVFADAAPSPTGADAGAIITATISNQDSSSHNYNYDIINDTTSTTLSTGSVSISSGNTSTINYNATSSEVSSGDQIKLEITGDNLITPSSGITSSYTSLVISSKSDHNHGTAADYGIFEPNNEPDVDVDVIVDGTTVTTVNDVSVGDEAGPIRIEDDLSDPVSGAYHDIELKPVQTGGSENGRARLNATIYSKVFIESTL